ncbi:MAG: hypothetical protein Q8O83_03100 [bacterium]|nr:hypothetical protein [bacterium]
MQICPSSSKKIFLYSFFGIALCLILFSNPASAQDIQPCSNFSSGGFFFADFEEAEYVDGLLRLHFQVNSAYGAFWIFELHSFSDECGIGTHNTDQTFRGYVFLTPGVEKFSVRFISPTHFEIWNDDDEIPEACPNCRGDIPSFPEYYQIAARGIAFNLQGGFFSSSFFVREQPSAPPIKTETLPGPENCEEFAASGNYFDNYEYVEYVDGLLHAYFRLRTPFNHGDSWRSTMRFHDESCSFVSETNLRLLNTTLPPYVRYYSVRFSSPTHFDIWNDETNTIAICDGCSVDIPDALPDGSSISYVSFAGSRNVIGSFLFSTPFPIREEDYYGTQRIDPVIIIPGILGSADKDGVWIIDPIFHTYKDLIETFWANRYELGLNLFPMPYDWRQSNVLTAIQLEEEIEKIKEICSCEKVDIVAHSMGGLIARQYIQSDRYNDDIDQLIFLGTPHLGAPKTYMMWEAGDFGPSRRDGAFEFIFTREAKKLNFENLFDYIRNKPIVSVQELLPIYSYLFENNNLRIHPNNYPVNTFLENLKNSIDVLLNSGVRITNIIGNTEEQSTRISFDVETSDELPLWEHGKPININFGFGDGTVPLPSANFINEDLVVTDFSHIYLPTGAEALIFKELTGEYPSIVFDTNSFFKADFKILLVKILSPIDVMITAPDGKRIGKNFETGEEFDEIEDAFYSGFLTDNEYVTIPNPLDGEYTIQTQGTGDGGGYTVAVGYISEKGTKEIEFNGVSAPEAFKDIIVSIDNESPDQEIGFEITLDGIIKDIEMAHDAGWITKKNVKESLIRKIQRVIRLEKRIEILQEKLPGKPKIIKRIEKIEKKINKVLAKTFIKELETQKKRGNINESAYILLREDIEWLLNSN